MINRIKKIWNNMLQFLSGTVTEKNDTTVPSKKLYRKHFSLLNVEEIPEDIKENELYHVGEGEYKWLLVFKCPCGCREVVQLNLLKEASPSWRVKIHEDGDVSVYPSISRHIKCKSHFNITKNSVRWWYWLDD